MRWVNQSIQQSNFESTDRWISKSVSRTLVSRRSVYPMQYFFVMSQFLSLYSQIPNKNSLSHLTKTKVNQQQATLSANSSITLYTLYLTLLRLHFQPTSSSFPSPPYRYIPTSSSRSFIQPLNPTHPVNRRSHSPLRVSIGWCQATDQPITGRHLEPIDRPL